MPVQGRNRRTFAALIGAAVACALLIPALALGHLERPSYWPDPNPEKVEGISVGGKVPKAKSLGSALKAKGKSELHVVCQGKNGKESLSLLEKSIDDARKNGWVLRPSQGEETLSKKQAKKLKQTNKKLAKECEYDSVQAAVTDADNHDRVVVMPGRYTEPKSRKATLNDPKCNPSMLQETQEGAVAPSYEYQASCPNDQNLIHVAGREIKGDPLATPRSDRHGVPEQELGKCVRCGLQLEGSGVKPEDVMLDAGSNYENPDDPEARPGGDTSSADCNSGDENPCFGKHVVLRTDRSDGFVGRNFTLRGAQEHGFYTEETDGILLDKVKFFWNADYGHLSFTTDHHTVQNCDGFGSGDAVVYPGAAPQTGEFRKESFYPESRYNTTITKCDLHGSAMGYSGSMGNSVRVTDNHFYGNANGLTTDTLSAPGHPGFPADGMKIDNNWFYANNLDVYREDSPFLARVPQPIGTGFFWPGNNDGRFENNWVFDNFRQGTMLISIPDAVAGDPDGDVDPGIHCPSASEGVSTSCDNQYSQNKMGQVPPDFKPFPELEMFGNKTTLTGDAKTAPNGVDFWWDEATPNTGNCWFDNTGPDGSAGSVTGNPASLPANCETSVGSPNYGSKVPFLLNCFAQWESKEFDAPGCGWWDTPAAPGTAAARAERRDEERLQDRLAASSEGQAIQEWVSELSGDVSFGPTG
jgi:hypothetical protein